MNKIFVLILMFTAVLSHKLQAQIQFSGTMDMGLFFGGDKSSFISNGIHQEYKYPHFVIPEVNVLMFAPINDNIYVQARLQADNWGSGRLHFPRFTLANITWDNPDKNFSLSAGKFISPVGFYPKRNLTIDRTFYDFPLAYSYFINISDKRGYWPQAGESSDNYYAADTGLPTIYFGGYATGLLLNWMLVEDKINLEAALTGSAPASTSSFTNLANAAVLTHLTFNPNIAWQLGLSAGYGSFMQSDEVNDNPRINNGFEQYRQSLIGMDIKFGYGFWEIIAEGIFSNWKVPYYNNSTGWDYAGSQELQSYNLKNAGFNVDVRFEPPALTGSYIAFRFDRLHFFDEYFAVYNSSVQWDENITRLTTAFGYKLSRNVLAKVVLSEQTPFNQSQYSAKAVLSAYF